MIFLGMSAGMMGILLGTTVAAVVFLYWLKPPPQRVIVPSTLLWDRLLKEKKRNPFLDRLRWWISLMLALTIGLAVASGIGRPELSSPGSGIRNITVVIDNSATMATRTSDGFTRWEHAVAHAGRLLRQGSARGNFLILDTSGQAPSREPGSRRSALETLVGLTVSLGGEPEFPDLPPGESELFFVSDGVMVDLVPPEATLISVFELAHNVGITAFEIEALPSEPTRYHAFVQVKNASPVAKRITLRLSGSLEGGIRDTLTLQAGETRARSIDLGSFGRGPVRAVVTADSDAFSPDDYAFGFLPIRTQTRVALITPGSLYLENVLANEPRMSLEVIRPAQYNPEVSADVYIFDRFAPPEAPRGPALLFLPPNVEWLTRTLDVVEVPEVTGWNPDHPVLRFVALEDLRVDRAARIAVPPDLESRSPSLSAEPGRKSVSEIVVGNRSLPLILVTDQTNRIVRVSFALEDSNFPLHPGFPIFLANAMQWLMDEQVALARAPGRIEVPLPMAAVTDLEGTEIVAWPLSDRTVFVADQPGLYTVVGERDSRLRVAVNLTSSKRSSVNDSDLPSGEITTATAVVVAGAEPGPSEELWIFLLLLALLLVVVEWATYHKRLTV
ncbi:MAG: BatA domain-containing protein [Gemmatimonadetes bacterium]|nr:BatA domain-containing protein [Gemmatimonadota bacterium]